MQGEEEKPVRPGEGAAPSDASSSAVSRIACLVGATGMVGRVLCAQLLEDPDYDEVRVFTRRTLNFTHRKLREVLVDFSQPESFAQEVIGEVLFSTLGTTLKTAGSKTKQYEIDHDLNLRLAELACENGVPAYVLLSSTGASARSRIFYLRMKGELERDVGALPFQSMRVLRPGILAGERAEERPGEKLGLAAAALLPAWPSLAAYRPVPAPTVARAMRAAAADWSPGLLTIEAAEIFVLGADGT